MLEEEVVTDAVARTLSNSSGDPEIDHLLQTLRSRSGGDWLIRHYEVIATPARGWFGRRGTGRHKSYWELYLHVGRKYMKARWAPAGYGVDPTNANTRTTYRVHAWIY